MDLRKTFITNLKMYRKVNKISQMQLAELCSSSTNYIGEIEIGKKFPSIEMIQKISDALNIKPYKLFIDNEEEIHFTKITPELKKRLAKKIQKNILEALEEELQP